VLDDYVGCEVRDWRGVVRIRVGGVFHVFAVQMTRCTVKARPGKLINHMTPANELRNI